MTPLLHRVRSYEVDHQGYLFNGRYLEIADAAMTEFFAALGFGYVRMIELGFDPAVVSIEMQFSRPSRLDDELEVHVIVERVGVSSLRLLFSMRRGGEQTAYVRTTYVNVEADAARSLPIPDAIRSAITSWTEKRQLL